MKLALALALAPGVCAQQHHMLGAQGPTIALDRFAGFDAGAGPLSYAELPAAARTLDGKFSKYDHRKLPAQQSERDGEAAYQAASKGPPAPRKDDPLAHVASLRFLHIPKTGGTTVETFGKELGLRWGMYDEGFSSKSAEHRCSAWHVPQRPAKKGAHDRTFCVLRHPAERLVSEFNHEAALMQGGLRPEFHHEASEAAYCDGDRFDAWVHRALDQAQRRKNYMDCHLVQQTEYAQFCDLFARLPSLEADLKTLLGCYGDGREKLANHSVGHLPGGRVQQEKRGHEPRRAVDACARNLARRLGNSSLFNKLYGEDAKLFRDAPPPSCEPQSVRKFKKWPPPPPPCELVDGTPCNVVAEQSKLDGNVVAERSKLDGIVAGKRVRVPRDIYMLWDKGFESAPAYQKACLASWIHFNPTWTVHAMSMAEAEHLANISDISAAARKMYAKMKIQAKSDVIRTRIMLLHGGVWADASVACNKPLDEFLPEDVGFYAFVRHDPLSEKVAEKRKSGGWAHSIPIKPWVASWFLASERHSGVFELLWHAVEAFWAELADVTHADYFWWHETVARLFHEDEDFKRAVETLPSADPIHCIDDADHAPMYKRCRTEVTLRKFGPTPKRFELELSAAMQKGNVPALNQAIQKAKAIKGVDTAAAEKKLAELEIRCPWNLAAWMGGGPAK